MDSERQNNNIKMRPSCIVLPGLLSILNPNFYEYLDLYEIRTFIIYFSQSYRVSWYHQIFIYSPTNALVRFLKYNIKIYDRF